MKRTLLILSVAALLTACSGGRKAETIAIIPVPVHMTTGEECFTLDKSTVVTYPKGDSILARAGEVMAETLGAAVGTTLELTSVASSEAIRLERPADTIGWHAEGYTLNISYTTELTAYDRLSNSERFLSYLEAIGADENSTDHFYPVSSEEVNETPDSPYVFVYYPETASVNILEKSDEKGELYYETYFSVDVDRDLSDLELASGILFTNYVSQAILDDSFTLTENNVVIRPGQDPHFVTDSLIVGAYTLQPTNVYHSSVNLFLLVFVLPLLVFAYLLIRYGILTSLAGLATGEVYAALLVGLLSATRIPFNSYSAFGLLAGFSLALLLVVPLIGMNKVILKEKGIRRDATAEERAEITNAEAGKALPVLIGTILSLSVLSLAFFFLDASTIALGAIQLASALLVLPFLLLFSLPLYHFLSVHVSFRHVRSLYEKHREKHGYTKAKPAKDGIVYVDEDSPHETIIPGLNDFLR